MPQTLICPESILKINLKDKTYIVTGGNSGIGFVTAQQLAKQGAKVIIACRRVSEGEKAKASILKSNPSSLIEIMHLDLSELNSVRNFVNEFQSKKYELHGLVNNAGVMYTPEGKTKDGFETQFGTNHLGHFLLTELLLPILKQSTPSRIVILSSCYHDKAQGREGKIYFEDLNFEKRKYDGWEAYAQSKLANLLYAKHLGKRLSGSGVTAVSVHPGWVRTNLIRGFMPLWVQNILLMPVLKLAGMIEPWEGAQTTLYSLLAPEVEKHNGAYFSQKGIYRTKEAVRGGWPLHSPNPNAHDEAIAEKLDTVSRSLVGL
jgi:NAD(P)-dependent dehydrogenase (short-subunit alcohol dehydrogenase family)